MRYLFVLLIYILVFCLLAPLANAQVSPNNVGNVKIAVDSLFEDLINRPVNSPNLNTPNSFQSLLEKPLVSEVVTAGIQLSKLNPYIKVGATIAGIVLKANDNATPIMLAPKFQPVQFAGWLGSSAPPVTTASVMGYANRNGTKFSSPTAACNDYLSSMCNNNPYNCPYVYYPPMGCGYNAASGGYPASAYGLTNVTVCPSGYQSSGSNCVLAENPTNGSVKWPIQPVRDYVQPSSSGMWEGSARVNAVPTTQNSLIGQGTQSIDGVNPGNKNPVQTQVTPKSDGGIKFKHSEQFTDPVTQKTGVQVSEFQTNDKGIITSTSQVTYDNTNIENVTNNNFSPTTTNIDTSQLAKEATLQQTNQKLDLTNQKLDDIDNKLEPNKDPYPPIPEIQSIATSMGNIYNAIRNKFTLPVISEASGQCPVWSVYIEYFEQTFVIDIFCILEPYIKPQFQAIFTFVWAFVGFKILMSA